MHDARRLAVHLAIRPRLTLPAEPRAAVRRRWRMPPLALPAVGYWLAMGALTYGFTRLGPHPLDPAEVTSTSHQTERAPSVPPLDPPADFETPASETPLATAPPPITEPPSVAEPAPVVDPPAPVAEQEQDSRERERANGKAGRRENLEASTPRREAAANNDQPARREEPARVAMTFPEFTDSSRPTRREHAADGPRIDSLFDKADERPREGSAPDSSAPPESTRDAPVAASSCEAAIARNNEQITIGGPRGVADTTREAYAGILQNGRYLSSCVIPDRTVFEICAAVKNGRAVGITVVSSPANPQLNACVRGAVGRLKFPQNPRLDVTHTRFDAVKR
jgi:hypothetical protein